MDLSIYLKIPKISPRAYIFQRPFLNEGLIFGGAYIRRGLSMGENLHFKIDLASLIVGRKFTELLIFRAVADPRNSQKNTKYHEIRQKYFQIHVSKTYLILILAIRPFLFTPNIQIYLETSSLQQVNSVPKLCRRS